MNKVYFGDCRESLKQMKEEGVKVQTCITSPPYYGLRDYGTATWMGGDENCSHKRDSKHSDKTITGHANKDLTVGDAIYKTFCPKCGAVREDSQIGLEESPQAYVDAIVSVFAGVWDVLSDDGTLWVNLGDSYAGSNGNGSVAQSFGQDKFVEFKSPTSGNGSGIRPKNLIGIPWRVAFALQDFGWNLRQDIIWHKPNPMPESVEDRCTKSHEYIFLFSKSQKYYFDNKSIQEPAQYWGERDRTNGKYHNEGTGLTPHTGLTGKKKTNIRFGGNKYGDNDDPLYATKSGNEWEASEFRNKRSVWTVTTKPYKGAHFATFPEELVEPMVLAGSRAGDIVLDPFFGSGTTGQVAQNLSRKWIGCELNKDYEALQFERLKQQSLELI